MDVGTGGAGEPEALGSLLDAQDVGASGAEHQHGRGTPEVVDAEMFLFSRASMFCRSRLRELAL